MPAKASCQSPEMSRLNAFASKPAPTDFVYNQHPSDAAPPVGARLPAKASCQSPEMSRLTAFASKPAPTDFVYDRHSSDAAPL